MHALLLDTRNRLLRDEAVTRGLLDRSSVHAREVFRPAIQHSAAKLLLAHNHPSGDPTPSPQDLTCTKALVEAGKLIGIEVVDHLVMGAMLPGQVVDYYSFREHGLM
jgi:DNA repair protein RadC